MDEYNNVFRGITVLEHAFYGIPLPGIENAPIVIKFEKVHLETDLILAGS